MVKGFHSSELFTAEEIQKIEAVVAEVEKSTSGEIVTVALRQASSYSALHWLTAFVGAGVGTMIAFTLSHQSDWPLSPLHFLECQSLGFLFGFFLPFLGPVFRLIAPKRLLASNVDKTALAQFTALGPTQTRDHTGILILLCEREHRVEILADSGIHQKLGQEYWRERVAEIIQGFHTGKKTEALCGAIRKMGSELAAYFPPRPDDANELPNSVYLKEASSPKDDSIKPKP